MKAFLLLWVAAIGTCCAWPALKNLAPAGTPVLTALVNNIKGLTSSKAPSSPESSPAPTDGANPATDAVQPATSADQVRSKMGEPTRVSQNGLNGEIWYYPTTIIYLGNGRVIQAQRVATTPFPSHPRSLAMASLGTRNWSAAPSNTVSGPFEHGAYRTAGNFVSRSTAFNSTSQVSSSSAGGGGSCTSSSSSSRPVANAAPRPAAVYSSASSAPRPVMLAK